MTRAFTITPQMLARHDRPGPRYTSYPTAPQFTTAFGPAEYRARLAEADRSPEALSLYIHIPFCEHRCAFCGCHVVVTQREDVVAKYLRHLEMEIDRVAQAMPNRRDVLQLHWGGGTPSHLSPDEMNHLMQTIRDRFRILPEAEVAVEVDPRVTTETHVEELVRLGFNRWSLGVQDFSPDVQQAIGRNQTLDQTRRLLNNCRSRGVGQINFDLVYGLPNQSVESFRASLDQVLSLRPGRIAVYSYAHLPSLRPNQRLIDEAALPDRDTKFALMAVAVETLTGGGYVQIGMDHFALPGDELARALAAGTLTRNFMGYTVHAAPDMIAFGISGIGNVAGAYVQNAKKLSDYYRILDAGDLPVERGFVLDDDDLLRQEVIRSLMCTQRLSYAAVKDQFGIDVPSYFSEELAELRDSVDPTFFEEADGELRVTPIGQLFARNICMVFDRYLKGKDPGERPMFSRTV